MFLDKDTSLNRKWNLLFLALECIFTGVKSDTHRPDGGQIRLHAGGEVAEADGGRWIVVIITNTIQCVKMIH